MLICYTCIFYGLIVNAYSTIAEDVIAVYLVRCIEMQVEHQSNGKLKEACQPRTEVEVIEVPRLKLGDGIFIERG